MTHHISRCSTQFRGSRGSVRCQACSHGSVQG